MKKALLTCALVCLAVLLNAQDAFERIYRIPGALEFAGATIDLEGHYVLANETADNNIQVTRIAPDGTHEWTNVYPYFVDMGLYSTCVAAGPDGIVVVGFALGNGTASRDGVVLRIDLDGTLLSSTRVDVGGGSNAFHTLKATSDGFIAGGRAGAYGNDYDMTLTKFNTLGEIQWSRSYGRPLWDWAYDATELADGGFAVIGYRDTLPNTTGRPSAYLVRTDAMGNELWARILYSDFHSEEGYNVVEDLDGNLYIGGRSLGFTVSETNAWITKLSPNGNHIWTRAAVYGTESVTLIPDHDGGVTWLVHPQWAAGSQGDYQIGWGKFDADGNLVYYKQYGAPRIDYAIQMFRKEDNSLAILGITNSYGADALDWQVFLIQTDSEFNAVCDEMDSTLTWQAFTPHVVPISSITNSGFTEYPWPLGTLPVAVTTDDPCCLVRPDFTPYSIGSDGGAWGFMNTTTGGAIYSWDFGDGTTSTEQSPTHAYATGGTYMVCLTVSGTCGEATTCQSIEVAIAGIDELQGANGRPALYPSPADRSIVLEGVKPMEHIQVLDHAGRIVKDVAAQGRLRLEITVDDLPAGSYAVRVQLRNGTLHHLRAVVIH